MVIGDRTVGVTVQEGEAHAVATNVVALIFCLKTFLAQSNAIKRVTNILAARSVVSAIFLWARVVWILPNEI